MRWAGDGDRDSVGALSHRGMGIEQVSGDGKLAPSVIGSSRRHARASAKWEFATRGKPATERLVRNA